MSSSHIIDVGASFFDRVKVAPFAILRIGGLPADILTRFVSPELSEYLELYINERTFFRECSLYTIAALERTVPLAPDTETRNALIALKRDIYNDRIVSPPDDLLRFVEGQLPGVLGVFLKAQEKLRNIKLSFDRHVNNASNEIDRTLAECWQNPDFRKGVSASNPSFANRVERDWCSPKEKIRKAISRRLFSYAIRTAGKTSPFSSLTSNCILRLEEFKGITNLTAPDLSILTESRLNRGLVAALRDALLSNYIQDLPISFYVSPHVTIHKGKILGRSHQCQVRYGNLWQLQHSVGWAVAPVITEVLSQLPVSFGWNEFQKSLIAAGLDENIAARSIKSLLRRDIIRSELEWGTDCSAPAKYIADKLQNIKEHPIPELVECLLKMDNLAEAVSNESQKTRERMIRDIDGLYQGTFGKLGSDNPPEIRNQVYEDALAQGDGFRAGSGFLGLFDQLSKALNNKVHVSGAYIWLRDRFIQRYGWGGTCEEVASFIAHAWSEVHLLSGFWENVRRERMEAEDALNFADIPLNKVEIPLTLYVQVSGSENSTLEDPDCKIILNLAYHRIGWQSIRVAKNGGRLVNPLPELLRTWFDEVSAPRVPVAITVSSECNPLQAFPRCTDHCLTLDGLLSKGDIRLEDIVIRHNVESRLLELTTRDGVPIRTNYLGGAAPMMAWGQRFLVILLGEPFEVGRPSMNQILAGENRETVRYQKRVEQGRCVLIRATWWVRSSEILRRFKDISSFERMVRAAEFLKEFDIPRYTFAKGQATSQNLDLRTVGSQRLKPLWMDFHNIACIEQLVAIAEKVDNVRLMEALPGPGEHILSIGGRKHVSEFMFEAIFCGKGDNI